MWVLKSMFNENYKTIQTNQHELRLVFFKSLEILLSLSILPDENLKINLKSGIYITMDKHLPL